MFEHLLCRLETPPLVQSTYSSELTTNTQVYSPWSCNINIYPYQAIRINVFVTGDYRFWSNSGINMYGSIYRSTFDPSDPSSNLIASRYDGCRNSQFRLSHSLQTNTTYILVVTTYDTGMTGAFSIAVVGVAKISFTRIGEYACRWYFCHQG